MCTHAMGTDFLANVGTASAARDMDMVRQALGDDQINYLGFSYGTELGTAYVEQFGDHVRAMVLDGAIDPTRRPRRGEHQPDGRIPDRVQRLRGRLRPSADCPLGTDPAQWVDRYHAAGRPAGDQARPRRRIRAA